MDALLGVLACAVLGKLIADKLATRQLDYVGLTAGTNDAGP